MNNKKGYTLVELILTLAIIGIMVIPIFNAFTEANSVNLRSRRQISAAYLAQNELERVKGMTRSEFGAFDVAGGDAIDDDTWSRTIVTNNVSNGGSNFRITTTIENITDEFNITLNTTTATNIDSERDHEVRVELVDNPTNFNIDTNGDVPGVLSSARDVYLLFETLNVNTSTVKVVDNSLTTLLGPLNIDTSDSGYSRITLNIVGFDTLSDVWNFNLINQSDWTLDSKPFVDENNNIRMISDSRSLANVYIGNSFPVANGSPSTSEEYYKIVITVSHIASNGNETVYETIESTVGK